MEKSHFIGRRFVRAGLCALVAGILVAPGMASASQGADWTPSIWTGFEYQGNSDLDKGNGDFDYWMIAVGGGTKGKLSDSVSLALNVDFRSIAYDFDDIGRGVPDPWSTVNVARLDPVITYHFNEQWSILGGPIGEFSGENGSDFGDSLRVGGMLGGGWKPNDHLSIALGAIVRTEIEDSAYVQPFVVVNWGIADGLALNMNARTSRGGDILLNYTFGDSGFTLGAGGGFRRERFRLDDNGAGAFCPTCSSTSTRSRSRKDGVGQEEATVVKLQAKYAVSEQITIEAWGGTTIDGQFKLEDKHGDKITKSDYDNAGFGGIGISLKF